MNAKPTTQETSNSKTYYLVIGILIFFGIQIIMFFICYWNTQRIQKKANLIRQKISTEYSKLREEQYNGLNQALRLNYYLVNPSDPNNRVWYGGNPINHLQPVGISPGRGEQAFANKYDEMYSLASDPSTRESFWEQESKKVDWIRRPTRILDEISPNYSLWFKDGLLNMSYNCVDRHLKDCQDQIAVIYESPITNTSKTLTYRELFENVSKMAGLIQSFGVQKGDRVIIYLPMIPEAVFAMLGCARIGAIHSVVFGGFAPKELSGRIMDAQPKLIITASCGLEIRRIVEYKSMLDEALHLANYYDKVKTLVVQRSMHLVKLDPNHDFDYHSMIIDAPFVSPTPVESTHPLYILYTSGTTGQPKGIVRDTGGTAVALSWTFDHILDIKKGDRYFSTSDIGWVVGHTFIIYGPLLAGATTVIFEGKPSGTPNAGIIWKIIEKHKIKGYYSAPTALRVLRKEDPNGDWIKKYDISSLKHVDMAGERMDIPTFNWISGLLPGVLINDHYWQTETGWIISCNFMNLHRFKSRPGSCTKPCPGFKVELRGEDGQPIKENYKLGKIVIKLPLPPSFMLTLWGNDKSFQDKYLNQFPGYYNSGDAGYFDDDGFLYVMARIDDIINTCGHRLSTSAMEEALLTHKDLVEAAVVPIQDEIRGELPFAFVVLKNEVVQNKAYQENEKTQTQMNAEIEKELINVVRKEIGPVAALRNVVVVKRLPKTRSGKTLRGMLRKIINKVDFDIPPTIEDRGVIQEIGQLLIMRGFKEIGKVIEAKL